MAFNNEKIEPANHMLHWCAHIFRNVRSATEQKTLRKRECFWCARKIEKLTPYINHQFRYDGRIVTFSFHKNCYVETIGV